MEEADIEAIRGGCINSSLATDQAMFAKACALKSAMMLLEAEAIESSRGWSRNSRRAHDQAVFARFWT